MPGPETITVLVNGTAHSSRVGASVAALLAELGLTGRKVAVERNGEIVPRSTHVNTILADSDRLEIVVAVGGG